MLKNNSKVKINKTIEQWHIDCTMHHADDLTDHCLLKTILLRLKLSKIVHTKTEKIPNEPDSKVSG